MYSSIGATILQYHTLITSDLSNIHKYRVGHRVFSEVEVDIGARGEGEYSDPHFIHNRYCIRYLLYNTILNSYKNYLGHNTDTYSYLVYSMKMCH